MFSWNQEAMTFNNWKHIHESYAFSILENNGSRHLTTDYLAEKAVLLAHTCVLVSQGDKVFEWVRLSTEVLLAHP